MVIELIMLDFRLCWSVLEELHDFLSRHRLMQVIFFLLTYIFLKIHFIYLLNIALPACFGSTPVGCLMSNIDNHDSIVG